MCFFGGTPNPPPVIQQSPAADQAAADAAAAGEAAAQRTARGRRVRASSLIQTSGAGVIDQTGASANGKSNLGS